MPKATMRALRPCAVPQPCEKIRIVIWESTKIFPQIQCPFTCALIKALLPLKLRSLVACALSVRFQYWRWESALLKQKGAKGTHIVQLEPIRLRRIVTVGNAHIMKFLFTFFANRQRAWLWLSWFRNHPTYAPRGENA